MADRANRAFVVRKLKRVTTGARKVAGLSRKSDAGGICVAGVAQQTRQPRVKLVRVCKSGEIFCLGFDRHNLGLFRNRIAQVGKAYYQRITGHYDAA